MDREERGALNEAEPDGGSNDDDEYVVANSDVGSPSEEEALGWETESSLGDFADERPDDVDSQPSDFHLSLKPQPPDMDSITKFNCFFGHVPKTLSSKMATFLQHFPLLILDPHMCECPIDVIKAGMEDSIIVLARLRFWPSVAMLDVDDQDKMLSGGDDMSDDGEEEEEESEAVVREPIYKRSLWNRLFYRNDSQQVATAADNVLDMVDSLLERGFDGVFFETSGACRTFGFPWCQKVFKEVLHDLQLRRQSVFGENVEELASERSMSHAVSESQSPDHTGLPPTVSIIKESGAAETVIPMNMIRSGAAGKSTAKKTSSPASARTSEPAGGSGSSGLAAETEPVLTVAAQLDDIDGSIEKSHSSDITMSESQVSADLVHDDTSADSAALRGEATMVLADQLDALDGKAAVSGGDSGMLSLSPVNQGAANTGVEVPMSPSNNMDAQAKEAHDRGSASSKATQLPCLVVLDQGSALGRRLWKLNIEAINGVLLRNVTINRQNGSARILFGSAWDAQKKDLDLLRAQTQQRFDFCTLLQECVDAPDDVLPELVVRFRKFCEGMGFAGAFGIDGVQHVMPTTVDPMIMTPGPVSLLGDASVQAFLRASTARQDAIPRKPGWGTKRADQLQEVIASMAPLELTMPRPRSGENVPLLSLVAIVDKMKHAFVQCLLDSGWPEDSLKDDVDSFMRSSKAAKSIADLFAMDPAHEADAPNKPISVPLFQSSVHLHAQWFKFVASCIRTMRCSTESLTTVSQAKLRSTQKRPPLHPLARSADFLDSLAERAIVGQGVVHYLGSADMLDQEDENDFLDAQAEGLEKAKEEDQLSWGSSSDEDEVGKTKDSKAKDEATDANSAPIPSSKSVLAVSLLGKLRRAAQAAKSEKDYSGVGSGRITGQREFGVKYREQDYQAVLSVQHDLRVAGLLHNMSAIQEVEVYGGGEGSNPTEQRRDPRFTKALAHLRQIVQLPEYNNTILAAFTPRATEPNSGLVRLVRQLISDLTTLVPGSSYPRAQLWESDPAGLKVVYETREGDVNDEVGPRPKRRLLMDADGGARVEKRYLCVAEEEDGVLHFYLSRGHPNITEAILFCYLENAGYSHLQCMLLEGLARTPPITAQVASVFASPNPSIPDLPASKKSVDTAAGVPTTKKEEFALKVKLVEEERKQRLAKAAALDVTSPMPQQDNSQSQRLELGGDKFPEWGDETDRNAQPPGGDGSDLNGGVDLLVVVDDAVPLIPDDVDDDEEKKKIVAEPEKSGLPSDESTSVHGSNGGATTKASRSQDAKEDDRKNAERLARGESDVLSDHVRHQIANSSISELLGLYQRTRKATHNLMWGSVLPPRQSSLAMRLAREIKTLCRVRLLETHVEPIALLKAPRLSGFPNEVASLVKEAAFQPMRWDSLWLILHACGGSMQLGRACDSGSALVRDIVKSVGREAAVGEIQAAIRDINPYIPREPDLCTVYVEMMGHSEDAVRHMFEMSKHDLGLLLFRRIRKAMEDDEDRDPELIQGGTSRKKRTGYDKVAAELLSFREYGRKFVDGLFFMLPLMFNLLLVLTLDTGIYTSLRMTEQEQKLAGLAIMFAFVFVGGINALIARIISYYAFGWNFAVMAVVLTRMMWGGILISLINSLLGAAVVTFWYSSWDAFVIFGGYTFLFSILQLFMAGLYNARSGSPWQSTEGQSILASIALSAILVLTLFNATSLNATAVHFIGLGASDLTLMIFFIYVIHRRNTMFIDIGPTSNIDVITWFCSTMGVPMPPQLTEGVDADVHSAALVSWYANYLRLPLNHPLIEEEKFKSRAWKHSLYVSRSARQMFARAVMAVRDLTDKKLQLNVHPMLRERAANYSSEDSLVHWYVLLTGKRRPPTYSAAWDEMLGEAKKAMMTKRQTDLPHRGGILWDRARAFVAHGALYYAVMFADRFVRLVVSNAPFFVPSSKYELAVGWAQVYLLLAVGSLEPVVHRREVALETSQHVRVRPSGRSDINRMMDFGTRLAMRVYGHEIRTVLLFAALSFAASSGLFYLVSDFDINTVGIYVIACVGLTGFMLGGFNMLFLTGAQQSIASIALLKSFVLGEVVALVACLAAYYSAVDFAAFAWEDFAVFSLFVAGWAYFAISYPRNHGDDRNFTNIYSKAPLHSAAMSTSGAKWIGTGNYHPTQADELIDRLDRMPIGETVSLDTQRGRAAAQLITDASVRHPNLTGADHLICSSFPQAAVQLSHVLVQWLEKALVVSIVPQKHMVLELGDQKRPTYIPFAAISQLRQANGGANKRDTLRVFVAVDPDSPADHARIVAEALVHEAFESLLKMSHSYACVAELLLHPETDEVGIPLRVQRQLDKMSDAELVVLEETTDIKLLHHAMLNITQGLLERHWETIALETKQLVLALLEAIDPNRFAPPISEDRIRARSGLTTKKYELAIKELTGDDQWSAAWQQRLGLAQLLCRMTWALKHEARRVLHERHTDRTSRYEMVDFDAPVPAAWDPYVIMGEEMRLRGDGRPKETMARQVEAANGGRPSSPDGVDSTSDSPAKDATGSPRASAPADNMVGQRVEDRIVLASIKVSWRRRLLQRFDTIMRLYALAMTGDESFPIELHASRQLGGMGEPGGVGRIANIPLRGFLSGMYWLSTAIIEQLIWVPATIFQPENRLFDNQIKHGLFKTMIYDEDTRKKVMIVQRHHSEYHWTGFVHYDKKNHVDYIDVYPKLTTREPRNGSGRLRRIEYICDHISRTLLFQGKEVVETVIFGYGEEQLSMEEIADPDRQSQQQPADRTNTSDASLRRTSIAVPPIHERRPSSIRPSGSMLGSGMLQGDANPRAMPKLGPAVRASVGDPRSRPSVSSMMSGKASSDRRSSTGVSSLGVSLVTGEVDHDTVGRKTQRTDQAAAWGAGYIPTAKRVWKGAVLREDEVDPSRLVEVVWYDAVGLPQRGRLWRDPAASSTAALIANLASKYGGPIEKNPSFVMEDDMIDHRRISSIGIEVEEDAAKAALSAVEGSSPALRDSDDSHGGWVDPADSAVEVTVEYQFAEGHHPADARVKHVLFTAEEFGSISVLYNDASHAVTEVRFHETEDDPTELVSRYIYRHVSHPDIETVRMDIKTGKETRHETPLSILHDEFNLINTTPPMSFAEEDPLTVLSRQRTDVGFVRRAANYLFDFWLPKSKAIFTQPYNVRRARMLLWNHWERGLMEGVYAQAYDNHLLRKCKVLRPYWRWRDWGFIEKARSYVIENEALITPTIFFPSRSHLVVRISDLTDFVPGGQSHRNERALTEVSGPKGEDIADLTGRELLVRTGGSLVPALISPSRPLHVMGLDSGTWPADGGGVASCRRDLINRLPRLRWDQVAEVGSQMKLVQRSYQIERNVSSMTFLPLWGVDLGGPNQSVLSNVPYAVLAARTWRTTPEAISRYFVPLITRLVVASNMSRPAERELDGFAALFVNLYKYFQRFDWSTTWEHPLVNDAWRRAWLNIEIRRSKAIRRHHAAAAAGVQPNALLHTERSPMADIDITGQLDGDTPASATTLLAAELPALDEIDQALALFMHFLMPLTVPIPSSTVAHASHHGVQSVIGAVAKRLHGSAFAIWDHGILWRERLVAVSELYIFPLFVRNLLIGLTRLVVAVNFRTADVVIPCCSMNNPDWEARLGGQGLNQQTTDMWRRISPVINGMETDRFDVRRGLEHPQPTAVMLSHVYDLKDVKNAILAADFVVRKYQVRSYRLLIYGSLDKDLEYADECRAMIADYNLSQNVWLKGLGNAPLVLPEGWVFVNSSKSEGLPLALGEAGLAGLPVVCTDVGASSEVITCGSETYGCVVPARNPEALARGQIKVFGMLEDLEPLGLPPQKKPGSGISEEAVSSGASLSPPKQGPLLDSFAPIMPGGPSLEARFAKMGVARHRLGMRMRAYVLRAYTMKRYLREHEQLLWALHMMCRNRIDPEQTTVSDMVQSRVHDIVGRSDRGGEKVNRESSPQEVKKNENSPASSRGSVASGAGTATDRLAAGARAQSRLSGAAQAGRASRAGAGSRASQVRPESRTRTFSGSVTPSRALGMSPMPGVGPGLGRSPFGRSSVQGSRAGTRTGTRTGSRAGAGSRAGTAMGLGPRAPLPSLQVGPQRSVRPGSVASPLPPLGQPAYRGSGAGVLGMRPGQGYVGVRKGSMEPPGYGGAALGGRGLGPR